ncbi:hypothetical protein V8F06_008868 [Rhypophila decipiens]
MAPELSELTSRVLPTMTFRSTSAPASRPGDLSTEADRDLNPALARFRVSGTAIVTGGAGDLGSTPSRALLEHGLQNLAIFDITAAEQAQTVVQQLSSDFPASRITLTKVDITDADAVAKAVEQVVAQFGPITILLNFAGTVCCEHSLDLSIQDWRKTININTTGSFIVAQTVARKMSEAKTGGSIIFIASMSAHSVNFPQPQAAYNASKAAVIMLKSSLAAEWAGHGIRVNSISPGYMNTILNEGDGLEAARQIWCERNPMGRMGEREELTGVVVLLASRAGSYITGADIIVDGGQSLF